MGKDGVYRDQAGAAREKIRELELAVARCRARLDDGQFIVEGDEQAARRLLTREVQEAMLLIARQDLPVLEVKPGCADLNWEYDLTVAGVGAAVEVLGAIRDAPLAG